MEDANFNVARRKVGIFPEEERAEHKGAAHTGEVRSCLAGEWVVERRQGGELE